MDHFVKPNGNDDPILTEYIDFAGGILEKLEEEIFPELRQAPWSDIPSIVDFYAEASDARIESGIEAGHADLVILLTIHKYAKMFLANIKIYMDLRDMGKIDEAEDRLFAAGIAYGSLNTYFIASQPFHLDMIYKKRISDKRWKPNEELISNVQEKAEQIRKKYPWKKDTAIARSIRDDLMQSKDQLGQLFRTGGRDGEPYSFEAVRSWIKKASQI